MGYNTRETGSIYEQKAGKYLEETGAEILAYNYRCRLGEIDIIAKEEDCLVFCEVKYRKDERTGSPLHAVDIRKQKKLSRCASYYLMKQGSIEIPCRFDVIGITGEELTHIRNAFDFVM